MTLFKYDPEKLSPELKEEIEEMPEHKLYFVINHAGGVSSRVRHDSADHRPYAPSISKSMKIEEEMFQMQRHCIEQLKAKGILENPTDEDGVPTDEYWKWFKRWHHHVEGLPTGEWKAFDKAMGADEDVSRWYPKEATNACCN